MKQEQVSSKFWILGFVILVAAIFTAKMIFVMKNPKPQSVLVYGKVPAMTLTDQTGAAFDLGKDLHGKVWIANFIFTRCSGICPIMSGNMKRIAAQMPQEDIRFVSFTVDPEFDKSEVLAQYAKRFGEDPRWHFLTGSKSELHELSQQHFRLGVTEEGQAVMHSSKFVLVDREGDIRGYFDSEASEFPAALLKEAHGLLQTSGS